MVKLLTLLSQRRDLSGTLLDSLFDELHLDIIVIQCLKLDLVLLGVFCYHSPFLSQIGRQAF